MPFVGMVLCFAGVLRAGPLAWQVTVAGRDRSCVLAPGRPRAKSRRESGAPGRARRASGLAPTRPRRQGAPVVRRRSDRARAGTWASPNEALQLTRELLCAAAAPPH